MSDTIDRPCSECERNRALIAELEERLTALELEVRGAPLDIMLDEFQTATAKRDARQAAVDEYHRLQREDFWRRLPDLKKAADDQRAAYEAFMRERRFEP